MKPNDVNVALHAYVVTLETYRHHFDLFLKGIAVYLAIVSGCMALAYGKELENFKPLLLGLIGFTSVLNAIACYWVAQWSEGFRAGLAAMAKDLGIDFVPPLAATYIAWLCVLGSLGILIVTIVLWSYR